MSGLLRRNPLLVGSMIVLLGILVTFPLWQPLFVDEVVNEPLVFSQKEFMSFAQEEQAAYREMATRNPPMAETMVAAAIAQPTQMQETMPDEVIVLRQGAFVEIDLLHGAEGTATIYQLPDQTQLLRFENFRAKNGPDLYVYLVRAAAPRSHDELGDDYIDLGSLKGNVGNQNYAIPTDVDINQYNSVVIYCRPFQVVFSTATLMNS